MNKVSNFNKNNEIKKLLVMESVEYSLLFDLEKYNKEKSLIEGKFCHVDVMKERNISVGDVLNTSKEYSLWNKSTGASTIQALDEFYEINGEAAKPIIVIVYTNNFYGIKAPEASIEGHKVDLEKYFAFNAKYKIVEILKHTTAKGVDHYTVLADFE